MCTTTTYLRFISVRDYQSQLERERERGLRYICTTNTYLRSISVRDATKVNFGLESSPGHDGQSVSILKQLVFMRYRCCRRSHWHCPDFRFRFRFHFHFHFHFHFRYLHCEDWCLHSGSSLACSLGVQPEGL